MKTVPWFVRLIYPRRVMWRVNTKERMLYLTFDDGPVPGVTPQVLEILDRYDVKATFFMVGENAARYPELTTMVADRGHALGNHSHNHLKGWKTPDNEYYANIEKAAKHIPSKLFRPPHGQLRPRQAKRLIKDYNVVMWTVLSGDYRSDTSPEQCAKRVISKFGKGAIMVFHDSLKARENMLPALEQTIKAAKAGGWRFGILGEER